VSEKGGSRVAALSRAVKDCPARAGRRGGCCGPPGSEADEPAALDRRHWPCRSTTTRPVPHEEASPHVVQVSTGDGESSQRRLSPGLQCLNVLTLLASPAPARAGFSLVTVSSPEHFKELLSADLSRVSVLNFWAPWADVCKGMNEVSIRLSMGPHGWVGLRKGASAGAQSAATAAQDSSRSSLLSRASPLELGSDQGASPCVVTGGCLDHPSPDGAGPLRVSKSLSSTPQAKMLTPTLDPRSDRSSRRSRPRTRPSSSCRSRQRSSPTWPTRLTLRPCRPSSSCGCVVLPKHPSGRGVLHLLGASLILRQGIRCAVSLRDTRSSLGILARAHPPCPPHSSRSRPRPARHHQPPPPRSRRPPPRPKRPSPCRTGWTPSCGGRPSCSS
jgi:hypothetical protein